MSLKKELKVQIIFISLLVSIMIVLLLGILLNFEPSSATLGNQLLTINETSTQSANAVTSVVTYFRGLDTLGEVTILFLSIFGIGLGLDKLEEKENIFSYENQLLKIGVEILFPLIILFGLYIIIHGHLSPGVDFKGV